MGLQVRRTVWGAMRLVRVLAWSALALLPAACGGSKDDGLCQGVDCCGHGVCVAVADSRYCWCAASYVPVGECCQEFGVGGDPCAVVTCEGHGRCRVQADEVRCDCETGWQEAVLGHCVQTPTDGGPTPEDGRRDDADIRDWGRDSFPPPDTRDVELDTPADVRPDAPSDHVPVEDAVAPGDGGGGDGGGGDSAGEAKCACDPVLCFISCGGSCSASGECVCVAPPTP